MKDSIASVISQTYTHWELFVIDDASTDGTVSIVQNLEETNPQITLLRLNQNQGTGAARNKGIEAATGTFIAFLDADDLWLPEKLEIQVNLMLEKDLVMTYSSYYLMAEDGKRLRNYVEALPVLTYGKLLKSNYVGNLTGIYNARKTGKMYSPVFRKRQDWALWLNLMKKAGPVEGILKPLAVYRKRSNSLSRNKTALVSYNFNIYHEFLQFSFLKSCRYLAVFLWEHFFIKNSQVKSCSKI
ncbi:glycosyltransferase [Antarcticibacterium sp. 1MA-6-2]|uniref:glycosyltransferase family 2 protein n=1 Tax=Antarcticibacterium sp. 1MA-6-2 TaxID=2908210 RepID=UPI001F1A72CE|nr:glycosyltransferase [Antarcticibacterium sp. 1MA-6-2]UJH93008.1 glycosyltransferase [Antarcticibacterium sp. 1MA-6-2]